MFDERPPPNEAALILRALKTMALADDAFDPRERHFLEINQRLFDLDLDLDALPPIDVDDLAAGITAPELRATLVQRLVVMAMLDEIVHPGELALLRRIASALAVDEPAIETMQRLVEGRLRVLAFDLGRRTFGPATLRRAWSEDGIAGMWRLARSALRLPDEALHERYQHLGSYPQGSLGRLFYEHCSRNEFKLPGDRGGPPPHLVFHDLGHVLAGYDTDPLGEVQMGGFEAGYMREDSFSNTLLVLFLFHLGINVAPGEQPPARGLFDLDRFIAAYRRGRAMRVDLRAWDPWPFMDQPLPKVRDYLEIPAA